MREGLHTCTRGVGMGHLLRSFSLDYLTLNIDGILTAINISLTQACAVVYGAYKYNPEDRPSVSEMLIH